MHVRLVLAIALLAFALPAAASDDLARRLAELAPGIDIAVLERALLARDCALASGTAGIGERLAVIDFSLPSTEPRLWVFDTAAPALLYVEHVAHGRNSGENLANAFSNREGSFQTSLGLYLTAETYYGANGYSLRLDGLEPGLNDRARERAIVMHGAPYVDPAAARKQGRLGRSYGCPAVRAGIARPMIDTLKDGQLLFAWHPDWQQASPLAECPLLAGRGASGTSGHARAGS
jgi:hypothetical protein